MLPYNCLPIHLGLPGCNTTPLTAEDKFSNASFTLSNCSQAQFFSNIQPKPISLSRQLCFLLKEAVNFFFVNFNFVCWFPP